LKKFDYFRPQSLQEAWELKNSIPGARFIAGGTDLLVQIKNHEFQPTALISLRSIPDLATIKTNEGTRIGALATISQIIQHPTIGKNYSLLVQTAKCLASLQIRNVATMGGNLCNCSPSADMATPLLALEAKVRLQTAQANRDIQLDEFFKGPGESCAASDEILTEILLEPPPRSAKTIFLKKGRVKMDLAIASLAAILEVEGDKCRKARFAVGSVAPMPLRLSQVEAMLEGATVTQELIAECSQLAAASVSPITDIRATLDYRRHIIGVYMQRVLESALELN
jgi:carbon-monoxide dehydrogenase medium subunit